MGHHSSCSIGNHDIILKAESKKLLPEVIHGTETIISITIISIIIAWFFALQGVQLTVQPWAESTVLALHGVF